MRDYFLLKIEFSLIQYIPITVFPPFTTHISLHLPSPPDPLPLHYPLEWSRPPGKQTNKHDTNKDTIKQDKNSPYKG